MEERRLLLAVAISLLLLTAYQTFLPPPPPRTVGSSPAPVSTGAASAPSPAADAGPSPAQQPASVPQVADERERRVEAVSPDLEVAFTNRGARIVSWRLPRYLDQRGRPEEMVQSVGALPVRPLDIETGDAVLDARLRDALYRASAESVRATDTGPATIRFEYSDGDVQAVKTFEIPAEGYMVRVGISVSRGGREIGKRVVWGPGVANPSEEEKSVQGYVDAQAVARTDDGVERRSPQDLEHPWHVGTADWLGIEARYFTALWVPPSTKGTGILSGVPVREGEKPSAVVAVLDLATATEPARLYVGPKDHAVLARVGAGLQDVVDVGEWIGPIVLALARLLRSVNEHVGNYGWSIVVLTILINLVMAPLRHYSIANGVKMARLAPEMRVIQERYRKVPALDPRRQEMQKEIAELYARHGMSMSTQMLVGCLPLLITMPFLIAFYRVLSVSIELRGASWLWIPDLSQRDPWFLTPLLMGVSMFVMQKMMPTAMDAAQQKVMLIMPVVLTVMFFAAPSGLNLYWLASNVCSIVQQAVTLWLLGDGGNDGRKK